MAPQRSSHPVGWSEAIRAFIKIAVHSFGGPAGQIAVMHRVLVDEKKWLSEQRFLHALNYCMLLPGPEAMQLVTYVGWLMLRTLGGVVSGLLFVLPGFISILALSILYAGYHDTSLVHSIFSGVKPAVLAIVVEALLRIGRRALKTRSHYLIAAAAFVSIFFLALPFPIIVAGAGLVGRLIYRGNAAAQNAGGQADHTAELPLIDAAIEEGRLTHIHPSLKRTIIHGLFWLTLWSMPFLLLSITGRQDTVFFREAEFFSKMAIVTFGGAYSVLAYVAQQAVAVFHWLEPGQMLDGLGMAETTPGPLIQVVQFVGFMGAHRNPGSIPPVQAGIAASLIVVWVTYVPCFLWIFVGAPYMEALRRNRRLSGALSAITAAVVGVILNLTLWFSIHTLFQEVREIHRSGMRLLIPVWSSIDPTGLIIAAGAALLLLKLKWGMLRTLALAAAIGILHSRLWHA